MERYERNERITAVKHISVSSASLYEELKSAQMQAGKYLFRETAKNKKNVQMYSFLGF